MLTNFQPSAYFPHGAFPHTSLGALAVTATFALAGYVLRGVSRSGAVAGLGLAYLIYSGAGVRAFAVLVALFTITLLATRLGRGHKVALGTAERAGGRGAAQVLANIGVAALFAMLYGHYSKPYFVIACAAALAEAAADTVSSECGQAFDAPPRLITTGARVPPGSNGAVSLPGTAFGAAAALTVALVAVSTSMIAASAIWLVILAALAGMFMDSLLGATLERPEGRKGWGLNNDAVNLLGTLTSALLAWGLAQGLAQ